MSSPYSLSIEHGFSTKHSCKIPFLSKEFMDAVFTLGPIGEKEEEKISYLIKIWSIYNGRGKDFNKNEYNNIATEWIRRTAYMRSNHLEAVRESEFNRVEQLTKITVPTIIIHGDKDPFFPIEHAQSLYNLILGSELSIINGMGHLLHHEFDDKIVELLTDHFSNNAHFIINEDRKYIN